MRIEKFQKTVIASNENVTKFHKKMNLSRLFVTTMEAFSQYGIIIFYFYDEKLKFGSLSIFEELFCCEENPDLTKMQTILENLHLWCEIKSNCFDVWKWMKEKRFNQSLSNGQKQRLILAKMLYWLNDEIDVLVLDECTSGLDDKSETDSADAERILEYIVRYANSDKKRIIIISTHQNIDGFKSKLADEFKFRNLQFAKEEEKNLVKEV